MGSWARSWRKNLRETITEADENEDFNNFKGTSHWLDSPDLKEKYKGKENQMQNIKDNARTFDHPTRLVKLYEDIEFQGETGMSNKRKHTRELELETEAKSKKRKREARPQQGEARPPELAKALAPSARKRLEKLLVNNQRQCTALKDAIGEAQAEKYSGYIANKILSAAIQNAGEAAVLQAEAQTVLEEGWMGGSAKPYEQKLNTSTPTLQKFTDQLQKQASDADELIESAKEKEA